MRGTVIALVAAVGLAAASAQAQGPTPRNRVIVFGAPGPDAPAEVIGTAFGTIPASVFCEDTPGFVTAEPDFILTLERPRERLTVTAESAADLILVVEKADGTRVCNDDGPESLNPLIELTNVAPGRYRIWVGVFSARTIADYTMRMSSDTPIGIIERAR